MVIITSYGGASHQGLSGVNNINARWFFLLKLQMLVIILYGSVLVGWNNTLSYESKASLITGRDNIVARTDYSIIGGFNNDVGQAGTPYQSNLVVGTNNNINSSYNIVGGSSNTIAGTTASNILSGSNNAINDASDCFSCWY